MTAAIVPQLQAGELGACERCGARAPGADPQAPPPTAGPPRHCLPCAVAAWFVRVCLRETIDPATLLRPEVHARYADVMQTDDAKGPAAPIDWPHVVAHWARPFRVDAPRGGRATFETFPSLGGAPRPEARASVARALGDGPLFGGGFARGT